MLRLLFNLNHFNLTEDYMKSHYGVLSFVLVFLFFSFSNSLSQNKDFIGTKLIKENGKMSFRTIPAENKSGVQTTEQVKSLLNKATESKYVLGGNVLWSTQDGSAIANNVAINNAGNSALCGWGLNNMRASLYSDANSAPVWDFSTNPFDPVVDISGDGLIMAVIAGDHFYILNPSTGNVNYQFVLPDTLNASAVSVSRNGAMAVFLSNASGNSTTSRVYAFDLSGTPSIKWTFDVDVSKIVNWTGVKFSADGSTVAITGRNHLYILNSTDGSLIWDHFVDNTESAPAISGDGKIVCTADNSGFVQTWHFNSVSNEYELLWQYRVPPGTYTNWASSVGISADGKTIAAGSLIFASGSTFDGTVICFDTYGDGTPKWIHSGIGDNVDDISVSDDGRVVAAVSWGDYYQTSRQSLIVFDVATGQPTFEVKSPGSFFTVAMNPAGSRVIAGGKAVHARELGNGGRLFLCEINLGGGNISGNVNLLNSSDNSGVLVSAVGTTHSAITDVSGDYEIKNIPAGTYTITAGKPGYSFGDTSNVEVTEGNTTAGINLSLSPFTTPAPVLTASNNEIGQITLNWILSPQFLNPRKQKEIAKAVGDSYFSDEAIETKALINNSKIISSSETEHLIPENLASDSVFVYRSQVQGGPYNKIGSVDISQLNFVDTDVFPLRHYYYKVNIVTDAGQSEYSNEALGQVSDSMFTFNVDVPQASVPVIDGILSAGEWDDAFKMDISDVYGYGGGVPVPQGSAFMYLKFDDNTNMLYIAGEDFLNPTLDDNEGLGLYFDDNNNNVFDEDPPFLTEGNFWAYWHPAGADLRFRKIVGGAVGQVITLSNAQVKFSDVSGHLQCEVAIPMGFMEGYQLQVFAPDKIVGLGTFLIARQAGLPVYHGYWPQTMNSLFNPIYFGDVKINVSLVAPPQPPTDIQVTRQGENLLITWNDPTLGLNNDPLLVPANIKLYRNGKYITTFASGVQSLIDDDVECLAWYEYQMKTYIIVGADTLEGPMTAPIGNYACEEPQLTKITYDDDNWDAFYVASFSWENNKFAVRFTPESYPVFVRKLETIVNSNDGFNFTVQRDINGVPGDTLAGPYFVYDTSPAQVGTVIKNIPGFDPPEITQGDFWIVINWLESNPGAPGIGTDATPPIDNRSLAYLSSTGWQPIQDFDIMIRAYVTDKAVSVDENLGSGIPLTFDLKQNYPNPFNPSTVIVYQVPDNEFVTLEIYNALGQKVRTLINEMKEAGEYQVMWNGKNDAGNALSSGVYLYRITAGNKVKVMKMMLIR